MELDEARVLKQAALAEFAPERRSYAEVGIPMARLPLAVGIAFHPVRGYRVAVRVQQPTTDTARTVGWLNESAHGEIDLQHIGSVTALQTARARLRPLQRGTSIGHPALGTGTLGAFAQRAGYGAGRPVLVSNNHVLANEQRAPVGQPIWQPGPNDGGAPADRVAALTEWVPLDPSTANRGDAAIAELDPGVDVDLFRPTKVAGTATAEDALEARKWGRTTGRTEGRVTAFEVDNIEVTYASGKTYRFDGQIEVSGDRGRFSAPGDSGSLVLTSDDLAVGLLFAGSESGGADNLGLSYVNPIEAVLAALDAELIL